MSSHGAGCRLLSKWMGDFWLSARAWRGELSQLQVNSKMAIRVLASGEAPAVDELALTRSEQAAPRCTALSGVLGKMT